MNPAEESDAYRTVASGMPAAPATAAHPPELIGRYRVEAVVGTGSFGLVYRASDEQLARRVAIKVPHKGFIAQPEDAEDYLQEARTVAGLDHPHIVPVYDLGSTAEFPYFIVSKYIEGGTLAARMKQGRPTVRAAVAWVATVAEALHHAHGMGLVHRDVKPGNILLDRMDRPFLADFGVALREKSFGQGPRYVGTIAYMSPEQARGEGHRVDGRSDIFSLGVVLYELLAGHLPFPGESGDELLEQIATLEPRPVRQWHDAVPMEVERICLKALAKRAADRFTTAKDMADDLRHFLAAGVKDQESGARSLEPGAAASGPGVEAIGATSKPSETCLTPGSRPVIPVPRIVPKGLRSFDAHDADFFLELLPGPRDRDGLPDSLRFWKTRIDETDADGTFAVGLIYGPSGCGKSSLVKAGLLPRLSDDVIAVYVEATAEDTETRLLNALRKRCPQLPTTLNLKDTLAALRVGQATLPVPRGKKVLIVLDQFEQWLHAKKDDDHTELVQALRQCDGGRLQAVVMVRDDFWLAVSRFMRAVEVRLVEADNCALVDLFDVDHARKVLAAFGRAFGKLPDQVHDTSPEQAAFLQQAAAGLAQEHKVICVRLALFAEMMKGRLWTPAALREVGGAEGVGATFLEETFSAATAPPEHRYHQSAARAVLQALLPETGTDIKGHMRAQEELLAASGYAGRPREFAGLLRILDGEVRLITPTDPEGDDSRLPLSSAPKPGTDPQAGSPHFYQLTHDYLVPSLRNWLTRKQKETRRGRAELLLADRAAVWNARPENRQLPSLWQWAGIRSWTRQQNWTLPQRRMMRRARDYHALRGAALAVCLALLLFAGMAIRKQVHDQNEATVAAGLVQALLNANTAQAPDLIARIEPYRPLAEPLLREELATAGNDSTRKLHASLALLPADAGQVAYLYGRLLDAAPHEAPVIRDALTLRKDELLDKLWAVVTAPAQGKESQRLRAASALAKYDQDSARWDKVGPAVADDLVKVPAVYLAPWLEALRPMRQKLSAPLAAVYRDAGRRDVERSLATDILADYAADQPHLLADLLMDGDDKQFAALYPGVKAHSDRTATVLASEIDAQPVSAAHPTVFEAKGTIGEGDAKVKVSQGDSLPAKRFEIALQAGKKYRLSMASQELDSFLVVHDKNGRELAFDDDSGGDLNALLDFPPPADGTYTVFAASFKGTGAFVLTMVDVIAGDDGKERLAKRQANAAVALLKMNQPAKVWPLLKHSPDPRVRSYLIHRLAPLGADAEAIVKRLDEEPDLTIRRALLLSLGGFGEKTLAAEVRQGLLPKVQDIYRTAADPGLHASAEWLLRTWKQEAWLKRLNETWATDQVQREKRVQSIQQLLVKEKDRTPPQWYVNGQGQTMVVIPGPVEFLMGSPPTEAGRGDFEPQHKRRIGRTFAIAAKSVTVEQYRKFNAGYQMPPKYTRMADLPVAGTSWYQAAAYCNWLSKQEGLSEDQWCYETDAKGQVTRLTANYLGLAGYRLPTEAEMEFAIRAGALTSRYFGETEELLPKYAWYSKNAQEETWPVGSLKPNDFGLFDVQGNGFTWCQDSYRAYPRANAGQASDDREDNLVISSTLSRVLRGGSFGYLATDVRSAYRGSNAPATRNLNFGFRPARTFPP